MTKRLVSLMALAVAVASPALASPPIQMAPKPMTNKTWWPDRLELSHRLLPHFNTLCGSGSVWE